MRIALYARVSKRLDQHPENQLIKLRQWASTSDYSIVGEYVDEQTTRKTRPMKEEVLRLLRTKSIDGVAFVTLDRWGRDMRELVNEMQEFEDSGQVLISVSEGLDLGTAAGRLAAHVLAALANFERERIRERTKMGMARAKAQGKHIGRPRKKKRQTT